MEMRGSPDRKPLMAELILETLKREQAFRKGDSTPAECLDLGLVEELDVPWSHPPAAGALLLVYDLSTNSISEATFGVSASLFFVIVGILLLIAARRLDRPAHVLIIIFGLLTAAVCIGLIVDVSLHASRTCIAQRTARCTLNVWAVHTFLLLIALVELTFCLLSVYASYKFLRRLATVTTDLLYASLISGRYDRLPQKSRSEGDQFTISTVDGSSPPASLQTA
ncbi:hypothetical protein M3Y99_00181100 [Aphelenchoides fujianensis]|nr:hypothetical protein M3Y99_00181100 [Aphelenchoides fujianensis]